MKPTMMKLHYYIVSGLVATLLLFTSCIREEHGIPNNGKTVNVNVKLSIRTADDVISRSAGTSAENAITQFHAFIFDRNTGMRVAHGAGVGTTPKLFSDLVVGTYRICVVGNSQELPTGTYDSFWDAVTYYSDLQSVVLTANNHLPIGGSTKGGAFASGSPNMVMYGENIVTLVPATVAAPQPITIDVERIAAKMIFNISNNITTAGESFLITKVSLVNTLANAGLTADLAVANYNNTTCSDIVLYSNSAGMNPTVGAPWTYDKDLYIFPNKAGTVAAAGSNQSLKGAGGLTLEGASKSPAYLLIEGVYTSLGGLRDDVTQRVYLGHDNHSDFNVQRNEQHTYNISITKADQTDTRVTVDHIYTLEFVTTTPIYDAHYIVYPIKVKALDLPGGWTLTSNQPWLTLRPNLTEYASQGYWIAAEKGVNSISSFDIGSEIIVYAYFDENAASPGALRTATLDLRPTGAGSERAVTYAVNQLPINWNGGFGNERIQEDGPHPWGFKWSRKVVYTQGEILLVSLIRRAIANNYKNRYSINYMTVEGSTSFLGVPLGVKITIDYTNISALGTKAINTTDGLQNTIDLFTFEGVGIISEAERYFDTNGWGLSKSVTGNSLSEIENFAAKKCVMKNKFKIVSEVVDDEIIYTADIDDNEIMWYLPANNQYNSINDVAYPLSGNYWTSTTTSGQNNDAFYYNASNGSTLAANRTTLYNIRCVRRNP